MCAVSALARGFDIRRHLGTKTRYAFRLGIPGAPSIYKTPDPDGYEPVHLYLVARHGTRWPTGDRMRQINSLERLFRDARNTAGLPWLSNWTAPFADVGLMGGELHPIGADELWGLAYRLRKRLPSLTGQDYLPKRFPVVSTQVARTAASASAFTSGFFPGVRSQDPADDPTVMNPAPPAAAAAEGGAEPAAEAAAVAAGSGGAASGGEQAQEQQQQQRRSLLEEGRGVSGPALAAHDELDDSLRDPGPIRRPQAVAISMAPKEADPLLRFFDVCPAYAQHDEFTERWMSGWMQGNWSRLTPSLERKLGLVRPMGPCEVEALWQLCLLEAGVQDRTDGACALFEPEDVLLLEWVDDIHLLETQSYGAAINYDIAAPLLRDAATALRAAAEARPGAEEAAPAARLLFAHCETLVPLASLLGLFRPPAPAPADASPDQLAAAVGDAAAAQRHLLAADSAEDLELVLRGLQRLNADEKRGRTSGAPSASASGAAGLTSEDLHVCYKGRPPAPPDAPPPPAGWAPMFPNDDARLFKGARIAPYGANLALLLYRRSGQAAGSGRPSHLVRLLYNEHVLPVPGCGTTLDGSPSLDCDLDTFLELVQDKIAPDALERLCGSGGRTAHGDGGANAMYARPQAAAARLRSNGDGAGAAAAAS